MRLRPSLPLLFVTLCVCVSWNRGLASDDVATRFVKGHCLDCHSGPEAEAGLSLDVLESPSTSQAAFRHWVQVHDRVREGEMPPPDAEQPAAAEVDAFLASLGGRLRAIDEARVAKEGRTELRRLNRAEYEATLRDLLDLPHLQVASLLPVDASAGGFDNVGSALNLSYVQMARHLEAANVALDEAMALRPRPETVTVHVPATDSGRISQVVEKGKEAVPIGEAVGLLRQPNTAQAPWTWGKFRPMATGSYRIRMKAFGFLWDRGEVKPANRPHSVAFYAIWGSTKRPLGRFDVSGVPDEPTVIDFTTRLEQGDQIEIRFDALDDRNLGQRTLEEYTAPGVAVEWLKTEGPIVETWPPPSRSRLFGDLPVQPWSPETGLAEPPTPIVVDGFGKRAKLRPAKPGRAELLHVVPRDAEADARRLLHDFAARALRRPVPESELDEHLALVRGKLADEVCFQEAMRLGFQSVLCSPEFLFLLEKPGRLDDHALASRLSYFLWSSLPDAPLRRSADRGELSRPEVLRRHVERMLDDPRSERFVENFTGQWLDLRRITVTQPDEELYPEFDRLLLDSMTEETRAYFRTMLAENLVADHVVDSDFAMVNGRLARHYGLPDVDGVAIRRVPLPESSVRGGLLTQASVLKVTANGTTTSPVTRGAWVQERLLGRHVPPPPASVPAIEPDLRGTTTVREQLVKHREDPACARCHVSLDPPGFALESFDVIGGWRDRYRSLGEGDPVNLRVRRDQKVRYKLGPAVDASGELAEDATFDDVNEFRRLLLRDRAALARNLVGKLLVYATGAELGFSDRAAVEEIVARTRDDDHGLRTLVHEIVQSETFRSK